MTVMLTEIIFLSPRTQWHSLQMQNAATQKSAMIMSPREWQWHLAANCCFPVYMSWSHRRTPDFKLNCPSQKELSKRCKNFQGLCYEGRDDYWGDKRRQAPCKDKNHGPWWLPHGHSYRYEGWVEFSESPASISYMCTVLTLTEPSVPCINSANEEWMHSWMSWGSGVWGLIGSTGICSGAYCWQSLCRWFTLVCLPYRSAQVVQCCYFVSSLCFLYSRLTPS